MLEIARIEQYSTHTMGNLASPQDGIERRSRFCFTYSTLDQQWIHPRQALPVGGFQMCHTFYVLTQFRPIYHNTLRVLSLILCILI